jgi:hypothetical protein
MVSKGKKLGIGAVFLCFLIGITFWGVADEEETAPKFVISEQNLVEIEEGFELDSYGFNRMNEEVMEGKVKRNESLYLILRDLDVSPQKIYEINKESQGIFRSNRLKPGQRYLAYRDKGTSITQRLVLHTNALDYSI